MLTENEKRVFEEPKLIDLQDNNPAHGECATGVLDVGCASGTAASAACQEGTGVGSTSSTTTYLACSVGITDEGPVGCGPGSGG